MLKKIKWFFNPVKYRAEIMDYLRLKAVFKYKYLYRMRNNTSYDFGIYTYWFNVPTEESWPTTKCESFKTLEFYKRKLRLKLW